MSWLSAPRNESGSWFPQKRSLITEALTAILPFKTLGTAGNPAFMEQSSLIGHYGSTRLAWSIDTIEYRLHTKKVHGGHQGFTIYKHKLGSFLWIRLKPAECSSFYYQSNVLDAMINGVKRSTEVPKETEKSSLSDASRLVVICDKRLLGLSRTRHQAQCFTRSVSLALIFCCCYLSLNTSLSPATCKLSELRHYGAHTVTNTAGKRDLVEKHIWSIICFEGYIQDVKLQTVKTH